ncbi:MAG: PIG-L family deacetylase, partial [Nonomuraea sp.]|nr:PIG-L family deacetylase [Nonomuraea sp.]
MLRALLLRFRPTVLRTLDPDPPRSRRLGDHPDHVASARFAAAAAAGRGISVVAYRGYPMTGWSPNLGGRACELKRQVFRVYRAHDYRVRPGWRYGAWLERMYRIAH